MTLKIHQVLLAIVLIVIGASLQYYTDGLPIGTLAFVVGLVWFLFGLAKHQTSYLALPFNQLEQATVPEQLPSLAIPLVTKNGSAAFLVMMVFVLPSLWLGVYLLETFARNSPFARGIPPNRKKTKNGNEISKTMAKSWIKSPNGC